MTKKINKTNIILLFILIITISYSGGFFEYISCGLNFLFILYMIYNVIITDNKIYKLDISFIIILFVVMSYLITYLWAIDKGFALLGFFKFLPVLFWFSYLRIYDDKEYIISKLPLIGCLLTIFTYTMSFFDVYKDKVEVAGRLGGSFQYPNTFAIFLLVCLIVNFWDKDFSICYSVVLMFGIYLSKSRTVIALAFFSVVLIAICNKKTRKYSVIVFLILIIGISLLIGLNKINMSLSTFYGRFLYYKDALRIIIKHPFGLGYYGYYFIQPSVQKGVYSVVNVHNELLQIMLDVGIVPALLFYGVIIYSLFRKKQSMRNRIVLLTILLHSLFDFDFQFVSLLFVLLLFIEPIYIYKNEKKISYGIVFKTIMVIIIIPLIIGSIVMGFSVFLYNHGKYEKSFKYGKFNTMAEIVLMENEDDLDKKTEIADDIIDKNKYIFSAYSVKAASEYSKGNIEEFIKYKEKTINLAPYNYGEYIDYLNKLIYVCENYIANGNIKSANVCLKRMKNIPVMLSEVEKNTDDLAWKIKDLPTLSISAEYLEIIDDLEGKINE